MQKLVDCHRGAGSSVLGPRTLNLSRQYAGSFKHRHNGAHHFLRQPSGLKNTQRVYSTGGSDGFKINFINRITGISVLVIAIYYGNFYFKKRKAAPKDFPDEVQIPGINKGAGRLVYCDNTWMSKRIIPNASRVASLQNFELREGDVMVVSFPKSGTTWVQEIVYLIQTGLDFNKAKSSTIEDRFPFLEYFYPGLESISKLPSPRLIKTHLPFKMLPRQAQEGNNKMIYIARNPKDVLVSYFHFVVMVNITSYTGSLHEFAQYFIEGKVPYGPWENHVKEFWVRRNEKNILFITYEEVHKEPKVVIKKIAEFLGHNLTEQEVGQIAEHTSFDSMKRNKSVNYSWWDELGMRNKDAAPFMRRGIVGDWKRALSKPVSDQLDTICDTQLKPHGLILSDTE